VPVLVIVGVFGFSLFWKDKNLGVAEDDSQADDVLISMEKQNVQSPLGVGTIPMCELVFAF
jgi:hypothetical protein